MIKVSVMHPHAPRARFDHDHCRDRHMPLARALLADGCTHYTIDRGVTGGEPGSDPTCVGACHLFSASIELFSAGMDRHGAQVLADIPSFTDITPVIQISDVVVGSPGR